MLKLLLCSALFTPCIMFQYLNSSETDDVVYSAASFDEYFVEPVLNNLEACQTAEVDIFFHDEYMTTHSAEYLADAISLSSTCEGAKYIIKPIQPLTSRTAHMGQEALTKAQTQELSYFLEAHGVVSEISPTDVEDEFNSLSVNGRTAVLEIVIKGGKSV